MPAENKKKDKKGTNDPAKRGSWLALIIFVAALAAVGAWFGTGCGKEPATAEAGQNSVKSTLHLESFVLNLADSDQRAYLRVGIDLGLNREVKRGEEVPVARVRDAILGVLAEARLDDLMTAQGKNQLKANLLRTLRERVPELGVEEVYFTEFLVQH
jgi:flagellar protein FliL